LSEGEFFESVFGKEKCDDNNQIISHFLELTLHTHQTEKIRGLAYSQTAVDMLANPHFAIFKLKYPRLQFNNQIIFLKFDTICFACL
jgi:hypothetical protein